MKAHPLQGKINIFFRPIQCEEDGAVLDYELGAKARISRTIFSDDGFVRRNNGNTGKCTTNVIFCNLRSTRRAYITRKGEE